MRWARRVARVGERKDVHRGLVGETRDLRLDERIILKWIFTKLDGAWTRLMVAHDRNKWRPVLNAIMSLRVS